MHILHKLGFAFLVFIGVLAILGWYLAPQDDLQKVDAIVAISGDQSRRFQAALDVYNEGWAKVLIFSGAANDPASPSNAAVMKQLAITQGVLSSNIVVDESSRNTRENARNVATIIRKRGLNSIILVTSPYHQRRANIEFQRELGNRVRILNYSAKDDDWRRSRWWITPRGWYLTLSESTKIALSSILQAVGGGDAADQG